MVPYVWGYILAAKVGCGIVAEIGSMRISDEIDALEVMGISSMTFLVRHPPGGRLDRAARSSTSSASASATSRRTWWWSSR